MQLRVLPDVQTLNFRSIIRLSVAALSCVLLSTPGAAADLFQPAPESKGPAAVQAATAVPGEITYRTRLVTIDLSSLETADATSLAGSVLFNLFDDTAVELHPARALRDAQGGLQWFGRLAGDNMETAVLSLREGRVNGSVLVDGRFYRIEHVEGALHRVREVEALRLAPPEDAVVPPGLPTGPLAKALPRPPTANISGSHVIDLLVCYTPKARNRAGGTTQIQDQIALAMAEANSSLANSGVTNVTWNLVATAQVNPSGTEAASTAYLDNLTYNMTEVHDLREQYGADVVSLWIDGGAQNGVSGIGWIMQDLAVLYSWYDFSPFAYNVVETFYARGPWYTFQHEVGHNLGSAHNRAAASNPGAFDYAYGFQQPGAFYTIMSYSGGCSGCSPVNNWSNPDVYINGKPTGVPANASNSADNAQSLLNTASIAEAFRASVGGSPNNPPTANPQSVTTAYQTAKSITLSGSDPDGDPLSYSLVSQPSNGSLSGSGQSRTYAPNGGYSGPDSFVFQVNDGKGGTNQATVSITVQSPAPPPNNPPTANDQSVSVAYNTAKNIVLTGSDPDGDSLAYQVLTQPANGALSGTAPNLVYTPNSGYSGADSLTFSVSDGKGGGDQGAVSITVDAAPPTPTQLAAEVISLTGVTGTWIPVALTGSFSSPVIACSPQYGAGSSPGVVRLRNVGGASFEVRMEGGVPADVECLAVEEGVYTSGQHGVTMEAIRFTSTQTDRRGSWIGQSRSYNNAYANPVVLGQVMTSNDAGFSVFWAAGSSATLQPSASALKVGKHVGEDPNTTRANETIGYIVIESGSGQVGSIDYEAAVGPLTVRGYDDGAPFSYGLSSLTDASSAVVSAAGMKGGNGGWPVLYGANAVGASTLALAFEEDQADDQERSHVAENVAYIAFGGGNSGGQTNVSPVANNQSVSTPYETAKNIVLTASDADNDPLTYQITGAPANGSLGGSAPNLVYTPNAGYSGADSFTFQANDGRGGTDTGLVSITVQSAPPPPPPPPPTSLKAEVQVVPAGWVGWKSMSLSGFYSSPVVVCTPNYGAGSQPLVTQVTNVSSSGFSLRLRAPDGSGATSSTATVHCVIVEAGVYNVAQHGIKMEAVRYSSTVTDHSTSWVGQQRIYQQNYSSPVVVGQVMTANGAEPSMFWTRGSSAAAAPTGGAFYAGKHVGEDPNKTRPTETVGYFVIEAGTGTIGSTDYAAGVGAASIRGYTDGAPFAYTAGIPGGQAAVLSPAGMLGFNGGWPILYGSNAISGSTLNLAFDEDQYNDSERGHTSERVAYFVLSSGGGGSGGGANNPPTANGQSVTTAYQTAKSITLSGSDPDGDSLVYSILVQPANGSLSGSGASRTYTPNGGYSGPDSFTFQVSDGKGGTDQATVSIAVSAPTTTGPKAEVVVTPNLTKSWVNVVLSNSYSSPVIVCTPNYGSGSTPGVVRMRNITSGGFQMKMKPMDPTASNLTATVHCLVVEEGVYSVAQNGVRMEAVKYLSTVTDKAGSFVGEVRTYQSSYANPVVLGQVMTNNQVKHSVFWAGGSSSASSPTSSALRTGKQVGEDPTTTRSPETIGYIVIESGSGSIGGVNYEAAVGTVSVGGYDDAPPFFYSLSSLSNASAAILSSAGMAGANGGHPILYGSNAVSGSTLKMAIDEDQYLDVERSHSAESVAYIAFQ